MSNMKSYNIEVNTNKQILSSETKIYKTESFFYQTKKLASMDSFVLKISESLLSLVDEICNTYYGNEEVNSFQIDTFDKSFSFHVRFGFQIKNSKLDDKDVVFYADMNKYDNLKMNDQRVYSYLKNHRVFNVIVKPIYETVQESDFKKLYYLCNQNYIV